MGISGKIEVEVDIKSKGDVFHELFVTKPHHVSNIVPDQVHGCDVHEGQFGKPGSIIQWEYTLDGKKSVVKEVIEAIDEEKKMVKFRFLEGDILNGYKSMSLALHVIPKGDIDAILWELDFERVHDFGPYPTNAIDFLIKMTRDLEAHHLNS